MAKKKLKHSTAPKELTVQEIKFCELCAHKSNRTQNYIDAGFHIPTAQDGTVNRQYIGVLAYQKYKKLQIRLQIRDIRDRAAKKADITVEKVARSLDYGAHLNRLSIFDGKGRVLPANKWPPELGYIISGIKTKEKMVPRLNRNGNAKKSHGKVVKDLQIEYDVKFENATESRKLLAMWLGMIGEKDIGGNVAMPLTSIIIKPGEKREELAKRIEDNAMELDTGYEPPPLPDETGEGGAGV